MTSTKQIPCVCIVLLLQVFARWPGPAVQSSGYAHLGKSEVAPDRSGGCGCRESLAILEECESTGKWVVVCAALDETLPS